MSIKNKTQIEVEEKALSRQDNIILLNSALTALAQFSTLFNSLCGQSAPLSKLLRAGLLAYADGTNWNPLSTGVPQFVMYDGTNWSGVGSQYTESTFTPTVFGSGTAGSNTYVAQVGAYIKTGRMVSFSGTVQINAKDAGMAGNVCIGGLPFTSRNITNLRHGCAIGNSGGVTFDAGYTQLTSEIYPNNNYIRLNENGSTTGQALPVANITNGTYFILSGVYYV